MIFIFLFLFSFSAMGAEFCDVKDKKTDEVVHSYEGPCIQKNFGGAWGDASLTKHVENKTRAKEVEDRKKDDDTRKTKGEARVTRLKSCATDSDFTAAESRACLQDLIKYVTSDRFTADEL